MADETPGRVAAELAEIRERGYRNGATGAECARLSDAAAVDIPRLLAAVEKALELAGEWSERVTTATREDRDFTETRRGCADELSEAITSALTGTRPSEDGNRG